MFGLGLEQAVVIIVIPRCDRVDDIRLVCPLEMLLVGSLVDGRLIVLEPIQIAGNDVEEQDELCVAKQVLIELDRQIGGDRRVPDDVRELGELDSDVVRREVVHELLWFVDDLAVELADVDERCQAADVLR